MLIMRACCTWVFMRRLDTHVKSVDGGGGGKLDAQS